MSEVEPDDLLTPAEVAALFRVNPKTVTRWARTGKVTAVRTFGGHRRFRRAEIEAHLRTGAELSPGRRGAAAARRRPDGPPARPGRRWHRAS